MQKLDEVMAADVVHWTVVGESGSGLCFYVLVLECTVLWLFIFVV